MQPFYGFLQLLYMLFSRKYTIKQSFSCEESWENMAPKGKGRHCSSCDKLVTDFTQMAPSEISAFLKNIRGNSTCARLTAQQLNNTYQLQTEIRIPFRKQLAGLILSLFGFSSLRSQTDTVKSLFPDTLVHQNFDDSLEFKWDSTAMAPDSFSREPAELIESRLQDDSVPQEIWLIGERLLIKDIVTSGAIIMEPHSDIFSWRWNWSQFLDTLNCKIVYKLFPFKPIDPDFIRDPGTLVPGPDKKEPENKGPDQEPHAATSTAILPEEIRRKRQNFI
jgi:hypothetical protein